jgi:nitroreductase
MNSIESIKLRKSSRTFLPVNIREPQRQQLLEFISENHKGLFYEDFNFQFIEHDPSDDRKMKNDYGLIVNHRNYLLAVVKDNADARLSYGYLMEKIVLKAVSLGIDSCWMGLFDPAFLGEVKYEEDYKIPALVILGYATERRPWKEKIIRYAVQASGRKPWDSLFFSSDFNTSLLPDEAGKYSEVLKMTRLSPSSGNSQPWRILKENDSNTFHFYKEAVNARYDKKGLHDVDLGICVSHFELSAGSLGLEGTWLKHDPGLHSESMNMEYKISWKEK